MSYSRFGVYTTEAPLRSTPTALPGNTATVGTFFGTSNRGPASPTLVTSWPDFEKKFGTLSSDHDLGYSVYHYFTNGGRAAYVTRVTGAEATAASTNQVGYVPTSSGASVSAFTLTARNVGTWGNSLTATVNPGTVRASSTAFPTFRLSIRLNGAEVETWSDLSLQPTNSRYIESVLNNFSAYVTVSDIATGLTPDQGFAFTTPDTTGAVFSNGSDGLPIDENDYASALALLENVEGTLLINCVGRYDAGVVNAALETAAGRGNSFVIIDPDPSLIRPDDATRVDADEVVNLSLSYSAAPGYGAMYYPMLKMVDPTRRGPAAIRDTFPGGAIAGAYVRTDTERGVHKTPAGYRVDIRGALGVSARVKEQDVDSLYDAGVNVLKPVAGAGVVILGARTLERTRPDKYISIRRSLNFVKQGINDLSREALFEPNDQNLWVALSARIENFLNTFWGQGGLKGNTSAQAFYVTCNASNNPPEAQEEGIVNVEVGVALQYPAEFIVVTVAQWSGGSNTAETVPNNL